jgi:hypothetical protein
MDANTRDKLKAALKQWMQVDTWNTTHPLDDKRFHRALRDAFDAVGTSFLSSDFHDVMMELAKENKPKWPVKELEKEVERFARRAEYIGSYLHDINE